MEGTLASFLFFSTHILTLRVAVQEQGQSNNDPDLPTLRELLARFHRCDEIALDFSNEEVRSRRVRTRRSRKCRG
jgi:hypothetical protein